MTTIACNRTSIAADLQVTYGSNKFKTKTKIYSFEPHEITYKLPYYVAFCGTVEKAYDILDWLTDPTQKMPGNANKATFLVLTQDKKIFTFHKPSQWIEVDEPYFALGSGESFALAAMALGKTPKEAVIVASKHDINTGMGFEEYSF